MLGCGPRKESLQILEQKIAEWVENAKEISDADCASLERLSILLAGCRKSPGQPLQKDLVPVNPLLLYLDKNEFSPIKKDLKQLKELHERLTTAIDTAEKNTARVRHSTDKDISPLP